MQQRLLGLVVNDAALMPAFAERHAELLALTAPDAARGVWGLGFHGHGEMLVKKNPVASPQSVGAALQQVRARHVIIAADIDPPSRQSLEDAQPLRYRDWLFAASGTAPLRDVEFIRAVQRSLPDTAFAHKRGATAEEALTNHFMETLHRAGARDGRKPTTAIVRQALGTAVRSLRELIGDTPIAVMLHDHKHLFALSLGRPLYTAALAGVAPVSGERRPARATDQLAHVRASIIRDWDGVPEPPGVASGDPREVARVWRGASPDDDKLWKLVESDAVEIGGDSVVVPFSLA